MIKSLAFVPPECVLNYYNSLYNNLDNSAKIIAKWFKQNYIGTQHKEPLYLPDFWCVANSVQENFPRTQNSVEAWHRRLKVVVGEKCWSL